MNRVEPDGVAKTEERLHQDHPPGYLLVMALGALGVVYGDIGTSPLYALRESFAAGELEVAVESVLGVVSLMFWALILVVSTKYLVFVMRADNEGEGGILALTALIAPRRGSDTSGKGRAGVLVLVGLFGTALLYGDGVITPAISVLSAVEGLEVVAPRFESLVIPLAIVILVGLFSIQHRGTAAVGALFGPVMIVWFGVLALLGIANLTHHPSVLQALSPTSALSFAASHPRQAFLALGAIFLVVTGSEALYADMGHFGRRPIRLGWFTVVFPALTLNYFGQGALVLEDPTALDNPFFRMAPSWATLPLVILATAATVIASQALISGAYSLTMQAVQLGYLPRVVIDHTSPREFGQVYVPAVNWALMSACVGVVLGFRSSTNLAAAYGVAVTTTMVITTILLARVMRLRWGWPAPLVAFLTAAFLTIDGVFFAANVLKIPAGGWFPLLIGGIVFTVMTTWKRGRELLRSRLHRLELPIERFIQSIVEHPQIRVPGTAVYLFSQPGGTPPALLANLRHLHVIHEQVVIVSVRIEEVPRVPQARRATVHVMGEGFVQVVLSFGFIDDVDVPKALTEIVHSDFGFDPTAVSYFLGKETVLPTERPGMSIWRERLFAFLQRNATSAADFFKLPSDQVFEVGVRIEI